MLEASITTHITWSKRLIFVLLALPALACLDEREGTTDTRTRPPDTATPEVQAEETTPAGRDGETCFIDEDCADDLACAVDCDDSCDTSQWPNPCCTAICRAPARPLACSELVGVEVREGDACPAHTTRPSVPGDWASRGIGCCLHEGCDWESRSMCEASSVCRWRLANPPQRPNDGTCESASVTAP